jgi:hypothetical protein
MGPFVLSCVGENRILHLRKRIPGLNELNCFRCSSAAGQRSGRGGRVDVTYSASSLLKAKSSGDSAHLEAPGTQIFLDLDPGAYQDGCK